KGVTERRYRVDPSQDAILANSPIRSAYDGNLYRSRLTTAAEQPEFPILTELRTVGVTDYVVLPVPFSDGTNKALSEPVQIVSGAAATGGCSRVWTRIGVVRPGWRGSGGGELGGGRTPALGELEHVVGEADEAPFVRDFV